MSPNVSLRIFILLMALGLLIYSVFSFQAYVFKNYFVRRLDPSDTIISTNVIGILLQGSGLTSADTTAVLNTLIASLFSMIAAILGALVAFMAASRRSEKTERRALNRRILSGLGNLASEMEDNCKSIRTHRKSKMTAYDVARRAFWFFPPEIDENLEEQLRQLYQELSDYNEELDRISRGDPVESDPAIRDYVTKHGLADKLEKTRIQLVEKAKTISYEI